jgi:hypothetical protein
MTCENSNVVSFLKWNILQAIQVICIAWEQSVDMKLSSTSRILGLLVKLQMESESDAEVFGRLKCV